MAKMGLGMGAGAPMAAGATRPRPNPHLNPQTGPGQRASGGFFGPRGSQQRHDLAMQFIQMAMQAAPGSGNPLLAALAPMAGAVIGARSGKIREDAKAAEVAKMTEGLLGPNGLSPEAREALAVMENENAPDYLRAIAKRQFDAAMGPYLPKSGGDGGGGRKRRSGGGGGSGGSGSVRLYGEYDIGGILHGRTKDGRMVPYTGPDGSPVPYGKGGKSATPAAVPLPPTPPDPTLPADPAAGSGGLTDDELLRKYGG